MFHFPVGAAGETTCHAAEELIKLLQQLFLQRPLLSLLNLPDIAFRRACAYLRDDRMFNSNSTVVSLYSYFTY